MKKSARFAASASICCAFAATVSGCALLPVFEAAQKRVNQGVARSRGESPAEIAARAAAEKAYRATLTPLPGGAGLVVCAPQGGDANFAAGCARWLQFHGAGQAELGQTPLWGHIDDVRLEMKKPNLRFGLPDALNLAAKTGATHVAVGTLEAAALRYQLVRVADKKTMATLIIAGAPAGLAAQLPALARQMDLALGVKTPRLPAGSDSATSLAALGTLPMKARATLPPTQMKQLAALAKTSAPAALMYLQARRVGPFDSHALREGQTPEAMAAAANLLRLAPENSQALGTVGWLQAYALLGSGALDKAIKRSPNNYLLQTALMCRERVKPQGAAVLAAERLAAERAVRSAPRNAVAWQELGWSISNSADAVRRARYWTDMTPQEQALVTSLYPQRLAANRFATTLDPSNAYGWWQMSMAAKFASDYASADKGIWTAISLEPDDQRWYEDALDMYQPKWRGDRVQLQKAVDAIRARPKLLNLLYSDCYKALDRSNMHGAAVQLKQTALADFAKEAATDPRAIVPREGTANIYWGHKDTEETLAAYADVLRLDPRHSVAHYRTGWMLHYKKSNYGLAETHYQAALAADPNFAKALNAFGDITYYVHGDAKKAEMLYRRAISLENDGLFNAELARLLLDTGRTSEARQEANNAIARGYTDSINPIWSRLGIKPN